MAVVTTHLATTRDGPAAARRAAGVAGGSLLAASLTMDPGRARLVLAVGAVIFLARATGLVCRRPPRCDASDGLVEIEVALLEHKAWTMERAEDIAARVERITAMVADLRDQVR